MQLRVDVNHMSQNSLEDLRKFQAIGGKQRIQEMQQEISQWETTVATYDNESDTYNAGNGPRDPLGRVYDLDTGKGNVVVADVPVDPNERADPTRVPTRVFSGRIDTAGKTFEAIIEDVDKSQPNTTTTLTRQRLSGASPEPYIFDDGTLGFNVTETMTRTSQARSTSGEISLLPPFHKTKERLLETRETLAVQKDGSVIYIYRDTMDLAGTAAQTQMSTAAAMTHSPAGAVASKYMLGAGWAPMAKPIQ